MGLSPEHIDLSTSSMPKCICHHCPLYDPNDASPYVLSSSHVSSSLRETIYTLRPAIPPAYSVPTSYLQLQFVSGVSNDMAFPPDLPHGMLLSGEDTWPTVSTNPIPPMKIQPIELQKARDYPQGDPSSRPLSGFNDAQLKRKGAAYAKQHDMDVFVREFELGAILAQNPLRYNDGQVDLNERERYYLRREYTHKWSHPLALYHMVVMCSVAAAVQGIGRVHVQARY